MSWGPTGANCGGKIGRGAVDVEGVNVIVIAIGVMEVESSLVVVFVAWVDELTLVGGVEVVVMSCCMSCCVRWGWWSNTFISMDASNEQEQGIAVEEEVVEGEQEAE